MQQKQIDQVQSPLRHIIATLEAPTPAECRAWIRMTLTERKMILRAANCPEHCALLGWQALQSAHRVALRRAAEMLAPNLGGIANA